MYEQWVKGTALSGGDPVIGPGRPIDTDRYYVIMVDPLGTWGASKPSDGLGIRFPQYSYYDMVQANYRMLRDHLKVARVALITGVSMGGTQTYVWGVMHPEFMGALMPIGGTTQSDAEDPVGNWTLQMMTAAIQSDPVWQTTKGDYYKLPKEKHPVPGVAFGWSVLGLTGYDFAFRTTKSFASVQPEVFYWDPPNEKAGLNVTNRAKIYDAVDLAWRNRIWRDPQRQSVSWPHPGPHPGDAHHQRPVAELQAGRARSRPRAGSAADCRGKPGRPLWCVLDRQPPQERSNAIPRFREGLGESQVLFERILEQTFGVSEGIWIGTPVNLTRERESGELERRMTEIHHPHLVLWGEWDGWIPPADLRTMAAAMPDCWLVVVPGIGHSMNLELTALYAGYFGASFGGLARRQVRSVFHKE